MGRLHGRGLLLIRTFMDEVEFNDRGNRIRLSKDAPPPPPGAAKEPSAC